MSRILQSKYFPSSSIYEAKSSPCSSCLWRRWMKACPSFQQGLKMKIGDRKTTNIWEHLWDHSVSSLKWLKIDFCPPNLTWDRAYHLYPMVFVEVPELMDLSKTRMPKKKVIKFDLLERQ
ncbi:gamma-glutamyl transpeptidase 1 [Striga asiatica]|uniref:Gamma-glutamyl transpeptidase 1 n=1 Tax=Striga asiatica TaxID=4170 RepID=A0A5A7PG77_STRAF|nr:gamma-glutamyl transpeptidase 1 [Striga asiatica]